MLKHSFILSNKSFPQIINEVASTELNFMVLAIT